MGFYKADFRHEIIAALGEHTTAKQLFNKLREINEDVKGMKTPVYNLKKKMMKAFHNIEIFET